MPARPPSRGSALSRRGVQLATATLLGVVTVALAAGMIALAAYEIVHCHGVSAWLLPYRR